MKKLVPFKKDIAFDTNIDEINSISLEFEVTDKKDSLIAGKFIISGDYKMASTSENLDSFDYELPFNINIDKKYDIDDSEVDINDFYYEVVNNQTLSVNIELVVDNVLEREIVDNIIEEKEEEVMDRCVEPEDIIEDKVNMKAQEELLVDINEDEASDTVKNLFDNLDDNEVYATYKIHIIRENDTIESIIMDYQVTREKLEDYNNLSDIKIGDKLIIPALNEN